MEVRTTLFRLYIQRSLVFCWKTFGLLDMIQGILEFTEYGYRILCEHVKAYEDIKPGELLAPYQDVLEALYANSCDNFFVGYILPPSLIK